MMEKIKSVGLIGLIMGCLNCGQENSYSPPPDNHQIDRFYSADFKVFVYNLPHYSREGEWIDGSPLSGVKVYLYSTEEANCPNPYDFKENGFPYFSDAWKKIKEGSTDAGGQVDFWGIPTQGQEKCFNLCGSKKELIDCQTEITRPEQKEYSVFLRLDLPDE